MFEKFPARWLKILDLMSQGLQIREVGERLNLSERYIKNNLTKIYRELNVKNGPGAVAMYVKWSLNERTASDV